MVYNICIEFNCRYNCVCCGFDEHMHVPYCKRADCQIVIKVKTCLDIQDKMFWVAIVCSCMCHNMLCGDLQVEHVVSKAVDLFGFDKSSSLSCHT